LAKSDSFSAPPPALREQRNPREIACNARHGRATVRFAERICPRRTDLPNGALAP
jgi:hypothetical protein